MSPFYGGHLRPVEAQRAMPNGRTVERNVGRVVGLVLAASTELQATAGAMSGTASETAAQSEAVASAAEEAASNIGTIAAAEEIGALVQEIGRQFRGKRLKYQPGCSWAEKFFRSIAQPDVRYRRIRRLALAGYICCNERVAGTALKRNGLRGKTWVAR